VNPFSMGPSIGIPPCADKEWRKRNRSPMMAIHSRRWRCRGELYRKWDKHSDYKQGRRAKR